MFLGEKRGVLRYTHIVQICVEIRLLFIERNERGVRCMTQAQDSFSALKAPHLPGEICRGKLFDTVFDRA